VSCTATSTPCTGTDHRITYVQATVTGTFSPMLAVPGIPSSLTVTQTAQRQVSQ
jgi:hypothetical protein